MGDRELPKPGGTGYALDARAELLDLMVDAIVVWEPSGERLVCYWNRGASMLYGIPADEAIGRPIHDLLQSRPVSDRYDGMIDIEALVLRNGQWEGELMHRARDGRRIVTESRMTLVHPTHSLTDSDDSAPPQYVLETNRDVTARHEADEAQRRREEYYRLLAEAGRILASSLDFQATLRSVARLAVPTIADYCMVDLREEDNSFRRVASAHVDARKEELVDQTTHHLHAITDEMHVALMRGETQLFAAEDDTWQRRATLTENDKADLRTLLPESMVMVPLTARGRSLGLLTVAMAHPAAAGSGRAYSPAEVTLVEELARRAAIAVENARLYSAERAARAGAEAHAEQLGEQAIHLEYQTEQARTLAAELEVTSDELRAKIAEAQMASRAKSDFLATISHEIRTPIHAMLGYNELMELGIPGPLTEQQRAYVERVRASGAHLLGIVDEILDLSRMEAGTMGLLRHPGILVKPVQAAVDLASSHADGRGVELESECDEHASYEGDEDRVRQIVVNLISNAIRFTDRGGTVTVRCGEETIAAGLRRAFVRVHDTGIGIAPDKLQSIFEPFVQLEPGLASTRGGTGLGLSISLRLARLMAGDLTVESKEGQGSTFTLWLPVPSSTAMQ